MYEASNERGDMSSDRLTDPHRPPSDTGSLSPPWDRERRIILPPSGTEICLATERMELSIFACIKETKILQF